MKGEVLQYMPFSYQHTTALTQLHNLYRSELQASLHTVEYVQGLIFGVCACPEIPMPDAWLPWVFKQHGQLKNVQQADDVAEAMMSTLQYQLSEMRGQHYQSMLPSHNISIESDIHAPISRWFSGVLFSHKQLEPVWQSCWQQLSDQPTVNVRQRDLKHCLMMFSTFADIPLAVSQAKKVGNEKLLNNFERVALGLPDALKTYVDLSGQLAQSLPDQFETFVQP